MHTIETQNGARGREETKPCVEGTAKNLASHAGSNGKGQGKGKTDAEIRLLIERLDALSDDISHRYFSSTWQTSAMTYSLWVRYLALRYRSSILRRSIETVHVRKLLYTRRAKRYLADATYYRNRRNQLPR